MQKVPALRLQDILQSGGGLLPGSDDAVPRFNPVVDNVTQFSDNTERLEKNLTATVVSFPKDVFRDLRSSL